jgi:cholesterol transport system auxiliary component
MNFHFASRPLIRPFLAALLAVSGCASHKGEPPSQFDFGPASAPLQQQQQPAAANGRTLVVADVTGSSALDNDRMFYRLSYANAQEARTYSNSRWSATPLQMLTQRFKTRLAQAGYQTLSETDATLDVPILRIDVDDFVQDFGGVADSTGRVAVRASAFRGHTLVAQRSFVRAMPASSSDAGGGARALAASTDAIAADIAGWLATLDLGAR